MKPIKNNLGVPDAGFALRVKVYLMNNTWAYSIASYILTHTQTYPPHRKDPQP